MANELILQGLKRLWKYAVVPSGGDMMMDPEEDDPVGVFLNQQESENKSIKTRRETISPSVVAPAAESPIPGDSESEMPEEIPERDNVTDRVIEEVGDEQMPEEMDKVADGSQPTEPEFQSESSDIGLMGELSETAVGEVTGTAPQPENQESEQVVTGGEEQNAGEVIEDDMADMLDIFKSESIRQVPDAIQDSLTDIDATSLLEIGREILEIINNR